jgi:hypothetical protein
MGLFKRIDELLIDEQRRKRRTKNRINSKGSNSGADQRRDLFQVVGASL